MNRKNGGFVQALVTSSTAVFYGKTVNIIIVKDISFDRNINFSNLDYQKLINTLNIGFFKARMDYKGKFVFANETAIRILGFDNFKELSETHILELIANDDDKKTLRKTLIENGYLKNKVIKISKKSGEYSMVKAAAGLGWVDEKKIVLEIFTAIKRAGAAIIISYHACDAAQWRSLKATDK